MTTTPTASSAATNPPKITSDVKSTKNPKRVEQGKKLAEISRQAKARKKALASAEPSTSRDPWLPCGVSLTAVVLVTASIASSAVVYYWCRPKDSTFRWDPPPTIVAADADRAARVEPPVLDSLEE